MDVVQITEQYVSHRPYVASLFLSVAIAHGYFALKKQYQKDIPATLTKISQNSVFHLILDKLPELP
ncbi:MAG: hypothetical protein PUP91_15785 [Rhizonema sp. PD37]|nr:hypothetical protein [Rhizonema sp. PD37]